MMHEVGVALSVPVGKFFEGLPSQDTLEYPSLTLERRIAYIGTSEGQRPIDDVLGIAPPLGRKLLALISKMTEGETELPMKLGDRSFEESPRVSIEISPALQQY
jgi:hypothetical protein